MCPAGNAKSPWNSKNILLIRVNTRAVYRDPTNVHMYICIIKVKLLYFSKKMRNYYRSSNLTMATRVSSVLMSKPSVMLPKKSMSRCQLPGTGLSTSILPEPSTANAKSSWQSSAADKECHVTPTCDRCSRKCYIIVWQWGSRCYK